MPDFATTHRAHVESLLDAGETLHDICAATQRSMFSGRAVAIGVTDRRLLLQPLDRLGRPSGQARTIHPEQVASARAGDAGASSLAPTFTESAAATLVLRTTDGDKLKLTMMRGAGLLGGLGGGEGQREGVGALASWFSALEG